MAGSGAILGLDTPLKKVIFSGYVLVWSFTKACGHGLKGVSKEVIVFETLLLKLALTTAIYVGSGGDLGSFYAEITAQSGKMLPYAVPSLLYTLEDILVLVILSSMDPRTFTLLSSIKLVLMGCVWSVVFDKALSQRQWAGLVLVTVGCFVDHAGYLMNADPHEEHLHALENQSIVTPGTARLLVLVEVFVIVLAAAYFELLVKRNHDVSLNVQNFFIYSYALVITATYCLGKRALTWSGYVAAAPPTLPPASKGGDNYSSAALHVLLVALSSCGGLITSAFMKHLDSVRKVIGVATQMIVDAILGYLVFGIRLSWLQYLSSAVLMAGILMYSSGMEQEARSDKATTAGLERPDKADAA